MPNINHDRPRHLLTIKKSLNTENSFIVQENELSLSRD